MEDYAAKMQLKPVVALREYVTGYAQYREAAVLAALDELRARGQPAPEEEALRPELESAAAAHRTVVAAAEAETARVQNAPAGAEVAAEAGPALYSPVSIVLFSMLTMLAGGVLMGLNLYRLGKKRALLGLALFMVVYAFFGTVAVNAAMLSGLSPVWGSLLFNLLGALAYVLWFWPQHVGAATAYRSRSVLVPVLVCVLLMWSLQKIAPYLIERQPKEVRAQLERLMRR